MRDLKNNVDAVTSISPAAQTATVNGAGVDLRDFDSAMVFFNVGTITDGTHTPKLQDSPDNSVWTDVSAGDQEGTLAALVSDVNQRVGYKGNQRYVRAVSTVAGATAGGVYSAMVMRGHPHAAPVA